MNSILSKVPRHLYIAAAGWVSRVVIIIAQLVAIPIFYKKLGLNQFAVFTVITNLTAWYSLMDFGLGNALQNKISEYRAHGLDPAEILSKIFLLISLLLLILAILLIFFGGYFQTWLFSKIQNSLSTLNFILLMILYCWYFVLLISNKIFFAYQKGFYGYFYQSIAYAILLVEMTIIHYFNINISLPIALYSWISPLFFASLLGFFHAYWQAGAKLALRYFDLNFLKEISRKSIQFWFIALSANGVLAIDYVVIVKLLSAKDVVTYNIINKVFVMMLFGYSAVLSALWPVLAECYAKSTITSIKKSQKELYLCMLGGIIYIVILSGGLILFRDEIVNIFRIEQDITLPISLLVMFGIYGIIRILSDTYAVTLQARNKLKIFIIQTPIQAIIAIVLMILFAKYDLLGIMLALILSFIAVPVWLLPFSHHQFIKRYLHAN